MSTRNYITINPWKYDRGLPRLSSNKEPHVDKLNKHYFRADPFKKQNDKPILMCLGDSFTYGVGVKDSETWPSILADKLDMVNWNMGTGGASNQDIFLLFRQMLSNGYIPNTVCIMWSFKHRKIISRNIISPIVEDAVDDVQIYSEQLADKRQIAQIEEFGLNEDITDQITTQWVDGDPLMQHSLLLDTNTDAEYLDFFVLRSAIVTICEAKGIILREIFLDRTLQKFTIANIVPAEGWSTGELPNNAYDFKVDVASDNEHFGTQTLYNIADFFEETL